MKYQELLNERIKSLNSRLEISKYNSNQKQRLEKLIAEGEHLLATVRLEARQLLDSGKIVANHRVKQKTFDSNQITNTITTIANMVFPEHPYSYFLDGKVNGEHTHMELAYRDGKNNVLIPSISNGKGLSQLVSLSSIFVITALSDVTPTLILDEPLSSISPDKASLAGEVLNEFTKYGFQILMIEHTEEVFNRINYYEIVLANINGETFIKYEGYVNNRWENDLIQEEGDITNDN